MSDVARLERELELAKSEEALEAARAAMHDDRSHEENMQAYKDASATHAALRTQFRIDFPPPPADEVPEGDAVATPETVAASSEVNG